MRSGATDWPESEPGARRLNKRSGRGGLAAKQVPPRPRPGAGASIADQCSRGENSAESNLKARDSVFSGNSAELGGAIYNAPASSGALEA
jgi:hypothetical protein